MANFGKFFGSGSGNAVDNSAGAISGVEWDAVSPHNAAGFNYSAVSQDISSLVGGFVDRAGLTEINNTPSFGKR